MSRFAIRAVRSLSRSIINLGHQKNAAGYVNKSMNYNTGAARQALYARNSRSTGGVVEDDYEVDYTSEAMSRVANVMYGECANAGQESLVTECLNKAQAILIIYQDFNPEHAAQPDEAPLAYIELRSSHPEAIGEIMDKGVNAFYDFAEEVNYQ